MSFSKNVYPIQISRADISMRYISRILLLFLLLTCYLNKGNSQSTTCPATCPPDGFQTEFYAISDNPDPVVGDEVCYRVFTRNFQNVVSIQLAYKFSSNSLEFLRATHDLSPIPNFAPGISDPRDDEVNIVYINNSVEPICLPDDQAISEVCFRVVGNVGEEIRFQIGGRAGFPAEIVYTSSPSAAFCTGQNNNPLVSNGGSQRDVIGIVCTSGLAVETSSICGTPVGRADGVVRLSFFCGAGPYMVNVDGVRTEQSDPGEEEILITGLSLGNHIFNVTDANGDTFTTSEDVGGGASMSLMVIDSAGPACATNGIDNGFIRLAVTGGSPNPSGTYFYDFGGLNIGETDDMGQFNLSGLGNGTFDVIVTDSLRCPIRGSYTLNTEPITVDIIGIGPSFCNGNNTGQIIASGMNGSSNDYRYVLEGVSELGVPFFTSGTTGIFNNLPAGTYQISAEDQAVIPLTCPGESTERMIINSQEYTITRDDNLATCPTGNSIDIVISASQGLGNSVMVQVFDTTGGTSTLVDGGTATGGRFTTSCLPEGTYQVIVDDAGCSQEVFLTIDGCNLSYTATTGGDLCEGSNSGFIELLATSTATPITFLWEDGSTDSTLVNLSPGTYSFTITDTDACEIIDSITLDPEPGVEMAFFVDSIDCPNGTTDIQINITSGIAPQEFIWDFDPNETSNRLTNVPAGTYSVTIIDDDGFGCELDTSITIGNPDTLDVSLLNISAPICAGSASGQATLVINNIPASSPIQGPFIFRASSGEETPNPTSNLSFTANLLDEGEQWITYTSANGCVDTVFFMVPRGDRLMIDTVNSDFGTINCDGVVEFITITAMAAGGVANVTYDWPAPFDTDQQGLRSDLPPGTYRITLTSGTCSNVDSFTIDTPVLLTASIDNNLSSLARCDGGLSSLEATANGGLAPYEFEWRDLSTNQIAGITQRVEDLPASTYGLIVEDDNGCRQRDTITIETPDPIEAFLAPVIQPECFGENGQIFFDSIRGGTGPYRFQIGNLPPVDLTDTADVLTGLAQVATIRDLNGCQTEVMFDVVTPEEIFLTLSGTTDIELGTSGSLSVDIQTNKVLDTIIWISSGPDSIACASVDCSQIDIAPVTNTTYTALVITEDGCEAMDDIDVEVQRSERIYIPNIFNPESQVSNRHQVFQIYAGSGVAGIDYFRIYDRWGNLVHQELNLPVASNDQGVGLWDGTRMVNGNPGQKLESGVYVYVVQVRFLGDETPEIRKGSVTLIR